MENQYLADDAHQAFRDLRPLLKLDPHANEATGRLRIIDEILFKVLRWDKQIEVTPERHVKNVGYLDYELGPADHRALILEAKAEGVPFVLPNRAYPTEPVPFSLIASECPQAAGALTQAQNYANQLGALYTGISNGNQWLLSMTFVSGKSIEDRLVYVFESLDAIQNDKFRAFFECFSPVAIRSNLPSQKLLDTRRAPAPAKLSSRINGYPIHADRNMLAQSVGGVLQLVWEAIDGDQDNELFLRNCYIPSDPSKDMLRVAQSIISQRASTDERLAITSVQPSTRKTILEHRERSDREQPVVILGRIGHGKSTFLKYLRHVEAKDILSRKYIQIDLNFLHTPATSAGVANFVMREIQEQLKDDYKIAYGDDAFARRVLKQELEDFRRSPRGVLLKDKPDDLAQAEVAFIESFTRDLDRYMSLVMRFIRRSHQKSVAVFFDNLDRRDDDLQEQAFLRAAAIANDSGVLVFVCLRPGSLQRSSAYGVLDTMAPRTLVIPQPDIGIVLRKRFQYATRYAAGTLPPSAYLHESSNLPEAEQFFSMCDQSVRHNPALAQQYAAVSNGNIRKVMDYVKKVLTSQHLDTHKIIGILNRTGEYTLAAHETLRALIFGPFIHFDPNTSLFTNLFDIYHADPTEHFSRILLLDYCQRHANSVGSYGFIAVTTVQNFMSSLGYSANHVTEVLQLLVAKDCLEGQDEYRDRETETPALGADVRITALGSFHITTLVRQFEYIDAMTVDTPILNQATSNAVNIVEDIHERLTRARAFVRYLDRQAEHLTDADARRVLAGIFTAVVDDITDIEQRIKKP